MIAILCTEGQMTHTEVRAECTAGKWVPILVYRQGEITTVPLFHSNRVAYSFVKRNLPADWLRGGIDLTDRDVEWIKQQGWQIEVLSFPRKMKDLTDLVFGFEILEFDEAPEVRYVR